MSEKALITMKITVFSHLTLISIKRTYTEEAAHVTPYISFVCFPFASIIFKKTICTYSFRIKT